MNDSRSKYVACVRRNIAKLDCIPVYEDFWFTFKSCIASKDDLPGVRDGEFHHILLTDLWSRFHCLNPHPVGTKAWGHQLPSLIQVTPLGCWEPGPMVACEHCAQEFERGGGITYTPGYNTELHFCDDNCRDIWRANHETTGTPATPATPASDDEF